MKKTITKKKKLEIEVYEKDGLTVYYDNDCYVERTLSTIKNVLSKHLEGVFYLFDLTRVFELSSTDDIFDIQEDNHTEYDYYIDESDSLSVFLEEEVGSDVFIDTFVEMHKDNNSTTLKMVVDRILESHKATLLDNEIIVLKKN